jgi:hypothetical protein
MSARGNNVALAGTTAALALALLVASCGARQPAALRSTSPPAQSTPSPSAMHVWIAVFQSAEDPNDLENAAEDLMDQAGTAVVVAPEGCFGGLRNKGGVGAGEYVLAVTAESRGDLDTAVGRIDREPVVTARVEDLCPV